MTKKTFLLLLTLTLAVTSLFVACGDSSSPEEEYTVTFNKNNTDIAGATGANPQAKTVTAGGTVTLPAPPTRTGYQFAGWYTVPNSIGGTQFLATTRVNGNITVYARWWNLQATVTFHSNDGNNNTDTYPKVTVVGGSPATLPPQPARDGYIFTGWNTKRDGTGEKFTGTTIVADTITVYAQWEQRAANSYFVTFDKNGGDTEAQPSLKQVKPGATTIDALPSTEPTKAGSKFMGWYTAPTGGTQFSAATTVNRDITVYARWEEAEKPRRTITFNVNGGTGTVAPIQVTVGAALSNLPDPASREGFTFTGWNTAANGSGTLYTKTSTMPNNDLTLFAQWQAGSSGGGATVVWQPPITASTAMSGSGEYIGNTGIQRGADASELTLTPIDNGFKATLVKDQYKRIIIQTPNAGGTSHYTTPDGFTACAPGKEYTITFMASVTSGTGQLRANANGAPSGSDPWDKTQNLTATPEEFSYTWTQGSDNLFLDTGNTATGGVIVITNIKVTSPSGSSGGPVGPVNPGATVVWQPSITAGTAMNGSGEYIGNTGIQRGASASELTLTPIDNGFKATVLSASYKQINIQTPNAGGTDHYTNPDGFTVCATGTAYTITFMVSVESGTGQLRAGANGASTWEKTQELNTTPTEFKHSWTQSSGNYKLDTGITAANGVIVITGIKITSP